MPYSLLAHLYPHIKGSQEDVATLSLQYIISRSSSLNYEFTRILGLALHEKIDTKLNYVCQSVGDNLERPDIAGIDENGKELILCEAKFYAGLTDNQPNGYLDRLLKNDGLGLIFICPSARIVTLWSKVLDLCKSRNIELIDKYCAFIDNTRMAIISWSSIIESLRHVASAESPELLPDIIQLDGFCSMMDRNAFIPFSMEDFGTENALREERYYQVIDEVTDLLLADKSLNAEKGRMQQTANRDGYISSIYLKRDTDKNKYGITIAYNRSFWRNPTSEETPFWALIAIPGSNGWKQPKEFLSVFNSYPDSIKNINSRNSVYLALNAPPHVTLDEIANSIVKQICKYIDDLEKSF